MTIRKCNAGGFEKAAVPLLGIDNVQAAARPANRIISLHLSQPEEKHPPEVNQ